LSNYFFSIFSTPSEKRQHTQKAKEREKQRCHLLGSGAWDSLLSSHMRQRCNLPHASIAMATALAFNNPVVIAIKQEAKKTLPEYCYFNPTKRLHL
jgi:hypothetical protein